MSDALDAKLATRRQAELVSSLRALRKGPDPRRAEPVADPLEEHCDICGKGLPADHRHLLHIDERYILCACESCIALRGGDREYRPTGTRHVALDDFEMPDDLWAAFGVPIGLAFFLISSGVGSTVALYPSPAGATESELDLGAWDSLCSLNPGLVLEPDAEALIVDRLSDPHQYGIAPIDECYGLVGMIKASWEGISGGRGPEEAIAGFFRDLREKAGVA